MEPLAPSEVIVTRLVHFNAAHRLHNPEKSDEWNAATYGPCNNSQWHGHNYDLEVSVAGIPDPETGYVIDLKELKMVVEKWILSKCDHANLNLQVDFLSGINPSSENLVIAFWSRLKPHLDNSRRRLYALKLFETPRNFVEYRG